MALRRRTLGGERHRYAIAADREDGHCRLSSRKISGLAGERDSGACPARPTSQARNRDMGNRRFPTASFNDDWGNITQCGGFQANHLSKQSVQLTAR